jgi:hypothetical protein
VSSQQLSPEMAERYGVGRPRRGLIAVVVLAVLLFLGSVAFVTWSLGRPQVQAAVVRFVVVDDSRVSVTFSVDRDGAATTTCVLRAQDIHHGDVGYAVVTIPPGPSSLAPTYDLATASRATIADVLGCADGTVPKVPPPQFAPGTTNPSQAPTVALP